MPTQVVVVPESRRVVRYQRDRVGNDLTAHLAWCVTHDEPLWIFGDQPGVCPHTRVVGWDTEDHVITTDPWETERR